VIHDAILGDMSGLFHHCVRAQASPRVVVVAVLSPEHCVIVEHDVEHDSVVVEEPVREKHKTLQEVAVDSEHELEDFVDLDCDVEVGTSDGVMVFGDVSGAREGGPIGGRTGTCIT
jgi:hypothetical protein